MNKTLLIIVLIAFGAFTAAAVWQDGLAGIFAAIAHSYGAMQIFADLVIALALFMRYFIGAWPVIHYPHSVRRCLGA